MAGGARPTGVLFDLDGTLVDTVYLHAVAWWEAFRQSGHEVPTAAVHRSIGMGSDHLLDHLLGTERDRDEDDGLVAAHGALFGVYRERLCPLPGAVDLLRACAARGLRVVLASSARPPDLAAMRRALDVDDVVDAVTGAADAESSKPDPDIVQVALARAAL